MTVSSYRSAVEYAQGSSIFTAMAPERFHADARLGKALALSQKGHIAAARGLLEDLLAANPRHVPALSLLGTIPRRGCTGRKFQFHGPKCCSGLPRICGADSAEQLGEIKSNSLNHM